LAQLLDLQGTLGELGAQTLENALVTFLQVFHIARQPLDLVGGLPAQSATAPVPRLAVAVPPQSEEYGI
jgi:hypothetical protein